MDKLPEGYMESLESLPFDKEAFVASMLQTPSVSLKLNRRKSAAASDTGYDGLEPVKWCSSGFYLPQRPQFTLNPLLHAGVFYVQEASSMIHEWIVATLTDRGIISAAPMVLDMCAAPGGKTTSVINALPDGLTVVANEFVPQRAAVLKENLLKWGYPRIMVTNSPTSKFSAIEAGFDLVVVDAPCSGEGMMRKEPKAAEQWSAGLVRSCAALQREILTDAVAALRPGGALIYSTCTFNSVENEENAAWLTETFGLKPVDLQPDPEWNIGKSFRDDIPALRFMPHLTRGEGLFAAVFVKPGDAPAVNHEATFRQVRKKARVILDGYPVNIMKGKVEIPASEQVLSCAFDGSGFAQAELDEATALSYLRHEAIRLDGDTPKGYVVVNYKGHPLGLVKNIGNRANNLYPAAWRIRNL